MNGEIDVFVYPPIVFAKDDAGNTFQKEVKLTHDQANRFDTWMIGFGGWAQYYAKDLFKRWTENNPSKKPFCIDMGGRNHKGSPNVCISYEDMDAIVTWGAETIRVYGEIKQTKADGGV